MLVGAPGAPGASVDAGAGDIAELGPLVVPVLVHAASASTVVTPAMALVRRRQLRSRLR